MWDKILYKIWGKKIQKSLEMAERAGRETADYMWTTKVKQLENENTALKAKLEKEITHLVNKKFSELNYVVNPDEILTVAYDRVHNPTAMFLNKRELNTAEIANLKQEARLYREGQLYSIFSNTAKDQAQSIMFTKSETYDDMKGGKMMLYNLSVFENILITLERFDLKNRNTV